MCACNNRKTAWRMEMLNAKELCENLHPFAMANVGIKMQSYSFGQQLICIVSPLTMAKVGAKWVLQFVKIVTMY